MKITNKTQGALSVPLPGGKKIHLGPGKSGEVNPKASEHPAFMKLVEAGDIEVTSGGRKKKGGPGGVGAGPSSSQRTMRLTHKGSDR